MKTPFSFRTAAFAAFLLCASVHNSFASFPLTAIPVGDSESRDARVLGDATYSVGLETLDGKATLTANQDRGLPGIPAGYGARLAIDLIQLGAQVNNNRSSQKSRTASNHAGEWATIPLDGCQQIDVPGLPAGAASVKDGKLLIDCRAMTPQHLVIHLNTESKVGRTHKNFHVWFIKITHGSKDALEQGDIALPLDFIDCTRRATQDPATDTADLYEWEMKVARMRSVGFVPHYGVDQVKPQAGATDVASEFCKVTEVWSYAKIGTILVFTRKPGTSFCGTVTYRYAGESSDTSITLTGLTDRVDIPDARNLDFVKIVSDDRGKDYYTWHCRASAIVAR